MKIFDHYSELRGAMQTGKEYISIVTFKFFYFILFLNVVLQDFMNLILLDHSIFNNLTLNNEM